MVKKLFSLFLAGISHPIYEISDPFWKEIRAGLIDNKPVKEKSYTF